MSNPEQHTDRGEPISVKHRKAFAFVVAGLLLFVLLNSLVAEIKPAGPVALATTFVTISAVCALLTRTKANEVAPALNIIVRVVAVLLGGYSLASGLTYPVGVSPEHDLILTLYDLGAFCSAAAALAAFRWPALILVPGVFTLAQKGTGEHLFNTSISFTDYIVVVELSMFLGAGLLVLEIARNVSGRWSLLKVSPQGIRDITALFVVAGIAIHFANYFYSGHAKLALDGGPWLWVLSNPTELLVSNAWVAGFLPTSHLDSIAFATVNFAEWTRPIVNLTILLGQLASVLVLCRRSLMIIVTVFYDITHVVIYLLTGIFFWKWIILNLAIVAAIRELPEFVERRSIWVAAMALLLFSPDAFSIVRLGWYDTRAQTISDTIAVTTDGREIRVPSNFFGTISVTAAQHRFGRIADGHYPTATWGTAYSEETFVEGNTDCTFDQNETIVFQGQSDVITERIQLAHAYFVERYEKYGDYKYDRFPHHIWSNPWQYGEFAALAPEDIDYYLYQTRSECVYVRNKQPAPRLDFMDEIRIDPAKVTRN